MQRLIKIRLILKTELSYCSHSDKVQNADSGTLHCIFVALVITLEKSYET